MFGCFHFIMLVTYFYCAFKKLLSKADRKLRNIHTNYTSKSLIIKFKRQQITLSQFWEKEYHWLHYLTFRFQDFPHHLRQTSMWYSSDTHLVLINISHGTPNVTHLSLLIKSLFISASPCEPDCIVSVEDKTEYSQGSTLTSVITLHKQPKQKMIW